MNTSNPSLSPVPADQRVFTGTSQAALWFSLGVGLLVMQVGAYLVPAMGTRDAFWAILLGSVLGSGLLAWTAQLGTQSGLSSAGLMQATYGPAFARLPIVLNIAQLIGWTTFEIVIMGEGTQAIVSRVTGMPVPAWLPVLIWGGLLSLLMMGSMLTLVRRFVSRIGLPLVILSLLWLSVHFVGVAQHKGLEALWQRAGDGSMGMLSAIDLVLAMPVSWLPLVADYSRYGQRSGSTLRGTWIGYALANIWCYALGVLVASVSEPGTDLVSALLLAQGGLLALGLILLDELDNAYGDVHSGAVSATSLWSGASLRQWGVGMALLCTVLAFLLPMHSIEPFLLMLSSVFVPLFGVILGRLSGRTSPSLQRTRTDWVAALIWLLGIGVFHGVAQWAPAWGSALPALAFTGGLAWLTRGR